MLNHLTTDNYFI